MNTFDEAWGAALKGGDAGSSDSEYDKAWKSSLPAAMNRGGQNMLGVPEAIGVYKKPVPQQDKSTFSDRVLGAAEAAAALGTGVLGGTYGQLVGILAGVRSGKLGTQEANQIADKTAQQAAAANTYQPRTEKGREYLSGISDTMSNVIPVVGLPGETAALARGAKYSLPAVNEATQAAGAKVGEAIRSNIDPEVARLARIAQDAKMPVMPHQLFQNRAGKLIGNTLNEIPLSGGKSDVRSQTFGKLIAKEIGAEAADGKITSDVYVAAKNAAGESIGNITSSYNLPASKVSELLPRLQAAVYDARGNRDAYTAARARLQDFQRILQEDGSIKGADFKLWNSKILKDMRDTKIGEKVSALQELQNPVMDAFRGQLPSAKLAEFDLNRYRFAVASEIQNSVAQANVGNLLGDISPSNLRADVLRGASGQKFGATKGGGPIGDVASIGKLFVEDPSIKTSPIERYGLYKALGAASVLGPAGYGAATANPALLAIGGGLYGLANAYNRLGPAAARWLTKPKEVPPLPAGGSGVPGLLVNELNLSPREMSGLFGGKTPDAFTVGQGAVTNEAARRFLSDQAAGRFMYVGNKDASSIRRLTNPTDVDIKPGPGEIVAQKGIGNTPYTELARGEGVTDGMVARFLAKLAKQDKQ